MPVAKQTDHLVADLNEQQREAVHHQNGPLLILAGAGSGKTRALTHRIARLMRDGVQPYQILSVTFTNKAATEMKDRICNLLHITEGEDMSPWSFGSGRLPVMGTFHSICARILRRDIDKLGRDKTFSIYDTDDQKRLMKEVLKEMQIDESELKPKAVLGYISRFKCEALTPKEAEAQATTARMQQVIQVYHQYQTALRRANALDFDDLILETVRLFHEVPEVLERYQNTWQYLHVDEYQDTNHVQYLFMTQLAKKERNLCVIGDPDQSIYAFRGADIRNILEFEKEYSEAKRIKLERNYRSTQQILTAADAIIAANPNRPEKTMWTDRSDGSHITVHEVGDEKREAAEALKTAEQLRADGVPFSRQAILYRTNAQSRLFEEAALRAGIPYRILGGVKFYARREVKDVLAYLHVLLNPYDTVSMLRILNVPARKIGQTTLAKVQAYAADRELPLWDALRQTDAIDALNDTAKKRIAAFTELIETYQRRSKKEVASQLTEHLLETIGMEKWLRDGTQEGDDRWANVQELMTVMHKYNALDPETSLVSFLEEVSLVSEVDALESSSDVLTFMTLHLCKGLEFDHVIIAGCEEGIFPHSNSLFDKEQLEEERRLMYVGMTRARSHLNLFCARARTLWGKTDANAPSRFLDELPDAVTQRRSDDVLSAFAWASHKGQERITSQEGSSVEPYRQGDGLSIEFNQDLDFSETEDVNQETHLGMGSRVRHPNFGPGTITQLRGDVATVQFDSGQEKTLALSIAPLSPL